MDDIIVIFSQDAIRGNILHKSLVWHGLHSRWYDKLYETEAAVIRDKPVLLIVDTVDCLSKTILFLKTLLQNQPNLRVFKLIESWKTDELDRQGIPKIDCYPDPFDPERIVDNVVTSVKDMKELGVHQTEDVPSVSASTTELMMKRELPPFFHEVEMTWYQKLAFWMSGLLDRFRY
ncbi:MAG: hypothetical protein HQK75_20265 [Candidatus Magnetomorum sp.]|nr:hypothetical protein [Candidatus Magnetomorum sp.]